MVGWGDSQPEAGNAAIDDVNSYSYRVNRQAVVGDAVKVRNSAKLREGVWIPGQRWRSPGPNITRIWGAPSESGAKMTQPG